MSRFQLTDFTDKQKLLDFLNYDGVPVTVNVFTPSTARQPSRIDAKPVIDLATLSLWWAHHRHDLALAFLKSPDNLHKHQTHAQFLQDCLSSIGIKGGTIKDRVARAKAARPDLYIEYAAGKAAEDARIAALLATMRRDREAGYAKPTPTPKPTPMLAPMTTKPAVDAAVSERQRGAASSWPASSRACRSSSRRPARASWWTKSRSSRKACR